MLKLDEIQKFIDFLKTNVKAAVLGIFLGIVYFYIIGMLFGIGFKKHMTILSNYAQGRNQRVSLETKLEEVDRMIDQYEESSNRNLVEIWQATQSGNKNEIIKESSKNKDALRFLGIMRSLSIELIKHDAINEDTHQALIRIYRGYLEIMNEEDPGDCKRAYDIFNEVNQHYLSSFPKNLHKKIQLELFRNMSYCAAVITPGSETQKILTDKARELQEEKLLSSEYKRNYFWIDLGQLIYLINHSEYDQADQIFDKMQRLSSLDTEFLTMKLKQHQKRINQNHQNQWESYLTKLN